MLYTSRLIALAITLNFIVGAIAWTSLNRSRLYHEESAVVSTRNLSRFIANDLASDYDSSDQALRVIADEYERQAATGKVAGVALNALIMRQLSLHPELVSIRIAQPDGTWVFGIEKSTPPPVSNIRDSACFIRHRQDPNAGLVVLEPVLEAVSGKWSIPITRRLNDQHGAFAGVILAFMDLDSIDARLAKLSLGGQSSISVRDASSGLIARHPHLPGPGGMLGSRVFSKEFVQALRRHSDAGTYISGTTSPDGVVRMQTYQKDEQYPIYVNVGVAKDDYLRGWVAEVRMTVGMFMAFVLTTSVGTWLLILAWRRREQTESKLQYQSQRLSEVVWSANLGTWEWNMQTGQTVFNQRWAEIVGYSLDELAPIGDDTWRKLVHPDDIARADEMMERCFSRENEPYECEARMQHKNGEWVWVLIRGRVVEWTSDCKPLRVAGTHQEITRRKNAENHLLLAASVFSNAREGIMITDPCGTIIEVNEAFTRITGYARDEVLGQNPRLLQSGRQAPEFYGGMWAAILEQGYWSGELWNRRKNGDVYSELLTISAISDSAGKTQRYAALFSDITPMKVHQQQRERSRILQDMHDGVGSHISSAIRQLQAGQVDHEQVLLTLRDALDQLKLSVDALNLPPGDVAALLANLRYRLEPRFRAMGLTLEWAVVPLPALQHLDATAMRQLQYILFEALSNAMQHAQASVLRIEATPVLAVQGGAASAICIRVCDNGRGFDTLAVQRQGLVAMAGRAQTLGAQLHIRSEPGSTVVEILLK